MTEVIPELARPLFGLGLLWLAVWVGPGSANARRPGWKAVIAGLALLTFGSLVGLLFAVGVGAGLPGDAPKTVATFCEYALGYGAGGASLLFGLARWLPALARAGDPGADGHGAGERGTGDRGDEDHQPASLPRGAQRRTREARTRRALEIAGLGDWRFDPIERRLSISDELARMLGLPAGEPREIAYESFLERFVYPDDRDRVRAAIDATLDAGSRCDVEYRVHPAGGGTRWMHSVGDAVRDDDGTVLGVLGATQDVSERRRAEHSLRESEERLRQGARLAGIGYYVWDAHADRCVYCSEENARIHGVTPEEYMAGASALDGPMSFVHPEDRERFRSGMRALSHGETFEMDYRIRTAQGETRWVHEVAVARRDEAGTVVEEAGVVQDITEIRQTEDRLRQAQRLEAVGQLTGGIAHDFNNLLGVIQGNVELLGDPGDSARDHTRAILNAVERGSELTSRLLSFSRRQSLNPRPIDLGELVAKMYPMLQRTLGETIDVEVSAGPGPAVALADPGQVENAVLNLSINSRDSMPGGGRLGIECSVVVDGVPGDLPARDSGYVAITVSDSGGGMAPDVVERAFEPFFTTKDVGQGSGLGLSMVYGFARQSGGEARIHSEPGKGTRVTVFLPRAGESPVDVGGDPAPAPARGAGEHVLVIEDDEDVRMLATAILDRLGYRVSEAPDAVRGREMLERDPTIEVLLSDVVLPGGVSGPELVRSLRGCRPDLAVIFMSGYSREATREQGLAGADRILLSKPFRMPELAEAMRAVLDA